MLFTLAPVGAGFQFVSPGIWSLLTYREDCFDSLYYPLCVMCQNPQGICFEVTYDWAGMMPTPILNRSDQKSCVCCVRVRVVFALEPYPPVKSLASLPNNLMTYRAWTMILLHSWQSGDLEREAASSRPHHLTLWCVDLTLLSWLYGTLWSSSCGIIWRLLALEEAFSLWDEINIVLVRIQKNCSYESWERDSNLYYSLELPGGF